MFNAFRTNRLTFGFMSLFNGVESVSKLNVGFEQLAHEESCWKEEKAAETSSVTQEEEEEEDRSHRSEESTEKNRRRRGRDYYRTSGLTCHL